MFIIKDIHPLMEYLRQHPQVGALFTFLVAFLESLPLIGTIIPGTVTMTAVGFLIGTGALPGLLALSIASLGALIGDAIGFVIGYVYNDRLRNVWPFKKHPKWLTLGENFFHKHGGKSIIIGRFVGPARSTVPLVAGLLRLTWFRFFLAATPSAILWAVVYVLPGTILGALSKEIPHREMTKFLLYGVGTIAVIWFVFWVIQHFFLQLAKLINRATDKLWHYLSTHRPSHWFIRLITNQQNLDDHHQLTLFIFALLSGMLFLVLLVNVRLQTIFIAWNEPIFHLLQSIHTPKLTNALTAITVMGSPKTMILLGVLLSTSFAFKKQWRASAHMIAAVILSAGAVVVFKHLSHSLRPQGFYIVANTSSFPSGHTALSFAILSLFTFIIAETIPKIHRWIPYTLTTVFICLVAFSRLYLGAHWFTDIIGSGLLATTIFFVCIISYHRMPNAQSRCQLSYSALAMITVISFTLAWGIQLTRNFHHSQKRYTRVWPSVTISKNIWWQDPLKYTPSYRNNRLGKPFQPFNIQWQDKLKSIKAILKKAHWQSVSHDSYLKSTLQRFASYNPEYHMPVLPWLYQGRPPALVMIKPTPDHKMILELRLWKSNVHLIGTESPLWLGATDVRIAPKALFSIKHRAKISLEQNLGLKNLQQDTVHLQHKILHAIHTPTDNKALHWDGKVLIIKNNI